MFLLDATLGMINIQQNDIIKIFSIAAVVFLPPTLVASVYGMNFELMPELKWAFGYPLALLLMVISAVLPYLFFKRKRLAVVNAAPRSNRLACRQFDIVAEWTAGAEQKSVGVRRMIDRFLSIAVAAGAWCSPQWCRSRRRRASRRRRHASRPSLVQQVGTRIIAVTDRATALCAGAVRLGRYPARHLGRSAVRRVYSGRRGTWVRAPFVNLWVPRD